MRARAASFGILLATLAGCTSAAAPPASAPAEPASAAHLAAVNARGDRYMGFDQHESRHHFTLTCEGGFIEVASPAAATRARIRLHLAHIAKMFAAGDFQLPMLIHARVPPGVPVMIRLRDHIAYRYTETPAGGRVSITTSDRDALAAVHDFLRFQIEDHQTGDAETITDGPCGGR